MEVLELALATVVIHNDSTYCLRHGDLTAVVEIDGRRSGPVRFDRSLRRKCFIPACEGIVLPSCN
jgi:hypothetical protein